MALTLMMVATMTLLTLSIMQSLYVYIKLAQQLRKNYANFYELESTVLTLINFLDTDEKSACVVNSVDPNQIIDMLTKHQGCTYFNKHELYEYLIDDLGTYPCIKIILNKTPYSSHHWLLTVTNPSHTHTLQLRIAKPDKILSCQNVDERLTLSGVISWRYL